MFNRGHGFETGDELIFKGAHNLFVQRGTVITEKTTVVEAMHKSKSVQKVFKKYKLDCASCRGASQDTIAQVAVNNGLDLKEFLDELNKSLVKS